MFTEDLWVEWSKQEEKNYQEVNGKRNYLKKGYTHFDHRFWFPERKEEIKEVLKNGLRSFNKKTGRLESWSFAPFLKVLVKTPRYRYQEIEEAYSLETKIRPICFSSHQDSLLFGFYSFAITKQYETFIRENKFDQAVLAYRSDLGNSNIQFSKEVFENIRSRKTCTAISLDIKGYFDHIDHLLLKQKWLKLISSNFLPQDQFRLFKSLTQYSYVNKSSILQKFRSKKRRNQREPSTLMEILPGKQDFEKFTALRENRLVVTNDKPDMQTGRMKGVPQGCAMSALLSNIYLIDFDKEMSEKAHAENFVYKRYCDDILIICDTAKSAELEQFAINEIKDSYRLTIQKKKVEVIDFHANSKGKLRAFKRDAKNSLNPVLTTEKNEHKYYKNLQYLGFEFNGQNIFIRSSSLSRYFRKMRARIIKTISMAYSPKSKVDKILMRQIFERYTHLGKRNFLSYAYKASLESYKNREGVTKIGMNSPAIRNQISRHFSILIHNLKKKNLQLFVDKTKKGKSPTFKTIK